MPSDLFAMMLAVVVVAAVLYVVVTQAYEYIFVPLPYHDPEPPVTGFLGLRRA